LARLDILNGLLGRDNPSRFQEQGKQILGLSSALFKALLAFFCCPVVGFSKTVV
jgi:hypothetical protein